MGTKKLKYISEIPIRNGVGAPAEHDDPSWPRYIRITDIESPRSLKPNTFKSLPPEVARAALVEEGDLLLAAVGATVGKGYFHWKAEGAACYAGYLVRVQPSDDVDGRFLAYWTESTHYWDQIRAGLIQSTIENFSAGKYRQLLAPTPPRQDQRLIADFLDRKTAAIDALIEKKERLIALLQEKRQALITQAVTKGLDPNVPMKDSGIEWLGEIPAHWRLVRVKHLLAAPLAYGVLKPAHYDGEDGIPLVRIFNVAMDGCVDTSLLMRIAPQQHLEYSRTRLRERDLIVSVVGTIGRSAVVTPEMAGANLSRAIARVVLSDSTSPEYVRLYLEGEPFQNQVMMVVRGTAQKVLNLGQLSEFLVPLPPEDEQESILTTISGGLERLERLCAACGASIDRLRDYRQALITAAVTGQLDVTSEAA